MKLDFRAQGFSSGLTGAICVVLVSVVLSVASLAQVSVLTHHNDNSRTGQNLVETYLTPDVVNFNQFGELFNQPVDGMVIGQPLYMPNLQINGASHNVLFVATLHDSVYAFDADSNSGNNASPLWYTSFINPPNVTTVPMVDQGCLNNHFTELGISGTPVIDPTTNTMYLVAKTKEAGNYVHRLHALDVTTGQEKFGAPVVVKASYESNGNQVTFKDQHRMQRPALLLSNGVVYIAFGSMGCKAYPPSTGWMMAYSASNLQQLAVLDVGPTQTNLPGIWMAGDGPAVDSNGDVYVATGDGLFDYTMGGLDYGDSLLKLSLEGNSLGLVDYFTPYNQADLDVADLDLGSSGFVILPDQQGPYPHLGIIAGKQGMIYLISWDNLGQYSPIADQVVQEVPFDPNSEIEILGGATYWNNLVYFGGQHVPIEAFSLTDGLLSTSPVQKTTYSYNFSSLFSISANGTENGILWGVEQQSQGSSLNAFQATNLKPLYRSTARDPMHGATHLVLPTIANGKVYVGTKDNVVVMGLLAKISRSGGDKQTGKVGTQLRTALRATVTDAYSGNSMPGVTIHFVDRESGGSFSNSDPVTNNQGVATTKYTLPGEPGLYIITASSPGFTTAGWSETAIAGLAAP
jgi:hypothetical protein